MQRRQLLRHLVSASAWSLGFSTQAVKASDGRKPALVVVLLRGAVDGLSVVAPVHEPAYAAARPDLALAAPGTGPDAALALDGRFGLHPALGRLMPWWQRGEMGFVHASGSPDPTRSHFDAQDYFETGTPGNKRTVDGWLNRTLAALPGAPAPTRAIHLGSTLPRIFSGSADVATLAPGAAALQPRALDDPRLRGTLGQLYANDPALGHLLQQAGDSRATLRRSLEQAQTLAQASDSVPEAMGMAMAPAQPSSAAAGLEPPANGAAARFAADALRLGQLLRTDAQAQLAFTSVGGWDTHINQGGARGPLANRLQELARALQALAQGLGPQWRDTVVVVCSEFGRTVRQNGSGGTDHGRGNVLWLLGGPVAGGQVAGPWPGLEPSALEDGRDLPVLTDFRAVLAPLLQRHLGLGDAALQRIFPGAPADLRALSMLRTT